MSTVLDQRKLRPYSADVARLTKVRLQSSNCPTILKHEVINSPEAFQPFVNNGLSERQVLVDRPRTASNATKMKFSFLQNSRAMASPVSGGSFRPLSGAMNSTINFDFLTGIGKAPQGKFKDKSRIKPIKKLKTEQFHNVIYKVKHQKELLEKEINRMEQWHKDFKENEIWNTPQVAIIDSILKMNALSNPDGNVGRYLQTEKEKEEELKLSKKFQRPSSSQGFILRRTPNNAKSVKDFFVGDDNGEEVIEEILSSKKTYYKNYDNNKQKITERIKSYVDNMYNYNSLMNSTKGLLVHEEDPRENVPKAWKHLDRSLKESKELSNYSGALADQGKSISEEIVESYEGSEISQSATNNKPRVKSAFNQTMQAKNRPVSANIAISTAFSPKNFGNTVSGANSASSGKGFFSQKMPSSIHSRPQTAKATRMPPSVTIATGLTATGEPKQQSIGSIKFIPIVMEGQKINVDPYNRTLNKSREGMTMSRKNNYQDEDEVISYTSEKGTNPVKTGQTALVNSSFKSISMLKDESDRGSQPEVSKFAQKRLMSAKASMRASSGTQTLAQIQEATPASVGKVNIDGEYFQTYSNGNLNSRTPTKPASATKSRKDVLESWVTKENQPVANYTQEAELC